jgi:hypothetical protein
MRTSGGGGPSVGAPFVPAATLAAIPDVNTSSTGTLPNHVAQILDSSGMIAVEFAGSSSVDSKSGEKAASINDAVQFSLFFLFTSPD